MICAFGFSLLTAEFMNSNACFSRGRSTGATRRPPRPDDDQIARAHVRDRDALGRTASRGPRARRGPSPGRRRAPSARSCARTCRGSWSSRSPRGRRRRRAPASQRGVLEMHRHDAVLLDRLRGSRARCVSSRPKTRSTSRDASSFVRPTSSDSVSNSPSRSMMSSMISDRIRESIRCPSAVTSSYGPCGISLRLSVDMRKKPILAIPTNGRV